MTDGIDVGRPQDGENGSGQYLQIEPESIFFSVPDVHLKSVVPAGLVATIYLGPSGDPRPNIVTMRLLPGIELQVSGEPWARTDETHFAPHDVPQLGQFVEARGSQERSETCHPGSIREDLSVGISGIGHRPELQQGKQSTAASGPLLTKQDRLPELQTNQDRKRGQQRRKHHQSRDRQQQIQRPFPESAIAGTLHGRTAARVQKTQG